MQILETSIYKASGFSTYFFHTLIKQRQISSGNYVEYKFSDRSKVIIRTNSEVVRLPAPRYGSDGRRINWGLRLGKDGRVLQTRDEFGNQIPDTHITGEKVSN
ncbi:hypothetical protein QUA27_00520 [Microcoleus sp. Pol14C6]|uniref:hypothetical protein n=1 Tax=unclassified Microcoleus TaxID=2642155 RepID=UPI002FCF6AE4